MPEDLAARAVVGWGHCGPSGFVVFLRDEEADEDEEDEAAAEKEASRASSEIMVCVAMQSEGTVKVTELVWNSLRSRCRCGI